MTGILACVLALSAQLPEERIVVAHYDDVFIVREIAEDIDPNGDGTTSEFPSERHVAFFVAGGKVCGPFDMGWTVFFMDSPPPYRDGLTGNMSAVDGGFAFAYSEGCYIGSEYVSIHRYLFAKRVHYITCDYRPAFGGVSGEYLNGLERSEWWLKVGFLSGGIPTE